MNGHDIFYITARKPEHCERTRKWLKDHGFPVRDEHFYCGMKDEEKIETILQLKLDYYFDDKPAVLETLLNVPTKVYAYDNSYNQEVKIPRLKHWSELKEFDKVTATFRIVDMMWITLWIKKQCVGHTVFLHFPCFSYDILGESVKNKRYSNIRLSNKINSSII